MILCAELGGRSPDGRLRVMLLAPVAMDLRTAVPVSSSLPAMRSTVPDSVTSEIAALPLSAAADFASRVVA